MKLLHKGKDGGPKSTVTGYWLIEWKRFFSIALLKFDDGSREAYHSHAFNSISLLLRGELLEYHKDGCWNIWWPGDIITTKRDTFHMVRSVGTSWILTFRGPWAKQWQEHLPATGETYTLESGRIRVD